MVGVAVGAVVGERDDHVRVAFDQQPPDVVGQGVRVDGIQGPVAVIQHRDVGDPEMRAGLPQLALPHPPERAPHGRRGVPDLTGLAARRAHHADGGALGRPLGHRPAGAEDLVVRVGEHADDAAWHKELGAVRAELSAVAHGGRSCPVGVTPAHVGAAGQDGCSPATPRRSTTTSSRA